METPTTTTSTTVPNSTTPRGHAFLITLFVLMLFSLLVWGYFLYIVPDTNDDMSYYTPTHKTQSTSTSSLDSDVYNAGIIDNSGDINVINQSFQ